MKLSDLLDDVEVEDAVVSQMICNALIEALDITCTDHTRKRTKEEKRYIKAFIRTHNYFCQPSALIDEDDNIWSEVR